MSAAGIARGLLGPVLSPKVAAPVAGGSLLMASDDAESKIAGTVKNVNKIVESLNGMVKNGVGNRNPIAAVEKVMHNDDYTNYNEMNGFATEFDGTTAGPYWKEQVAALAAQVREHPHLRPDAAKQLDAWETDHLGREAGYQPADRKPKTNHRPQPKAPANNAMAAALAAAAAGKASAGEQTSPEMRGFAPWSDYEPQPSYLDRVTDPSTYADALRPYVQGAGWLANTPVGKYVGAQLGEAMDAAQVPGQVVQGIGRGAYGLAAGESLPQAFSSGVEAGQRDLEENGALVKQWATDRGWHPDDAAAAGAVTTYGLDPLTYAGFNLLGKVFK